MSDHTLPTVTSNYSTLLTEFSNRIIDGMKFARSDLVTITANLITTGYIRFNTATHQFEEDTGVTTTKTWTALAVNASTVTTNANLTGPITSSGNATTVASQTGTGSTFAMAASPTFTGTPATTTAAVDTNTTQIASTAYVIGQTYLKTATAASTYAPLASPTFTGTVTSPQFTGPVTALKSATTTVSVSSAAAPSSGQGLVATSSTTATWQNLANTPDFLLLNIGIL